MNRELTNEEAGEMLRLYASGKYTQAELAAKFGCSQTTVSKLARRKRVTPTVPGQGEA